MTSRCLSGFLNLVGWAPKGFFPNGSFPPFCFFLIFTIFREAALEDITGRMMDSHIATSRVPLPSVVQLSIITLQLISYAMYLDPKSSTMFLLSLSLAFLCISSLGPF